LFRIIEGSSVEKTLVKNYITLTGSVGFCRIKCLNILISFA
jgi:hypothetical protein